MHISKTPAYSRAEWKCKIDGLVLLPIISLSQQIGIIERVGLVVPGKAKKADSLEEAINIINENKYIGPHIHNNGRKTSNNGGRKSKLESEEIEDNQKES
ncbi:hypothetical protein JHK85_056031 [Glycine max]|nr:hypothetical protein JHK85_056031 [Glycine max]